MKAKTGPDPEKQLKSFIDKFEPKHQALIRSVRGALRKRLPTANELVYDNYNFFVIGYCPNERPSDSIISTAAGANGVGLCFIRGAVFPIRIRYCLARELKLALSVLNPYKHWSALRSKGYWQPQLPNLTSLPLQVVLDNLL